MENKGKSNNTIESKLKLTKHELDKNLDYQINKNFNKRVKSYYEALRRLVEKYPDFKQESITYEDIKKLANYEEQDIKKRIEVRMLQKERNKMLSEERKNLEKQLNKQVIKEFNSSEVLSTAITKGIMIGLLRTFSNWFCCY